MKLMHTLVSALLVAAGMYGPADAAPAPVPDAGSRLFVDGKPVALPQAPATAPSQQAAARAQTLLIPAAPPMSTPPVVVPPVTVPPQCQNLPKGSYCLCTGGQCKVIGNP